MLDATGHTDRQRAGLDPVTEVVDGILTGHYTYPNRETGWIKLVKSNPPGILDEVVKEFPDRLSAKLWLANQWRAGNLR
jgi:hypothetical protein